MAKVISSAEFKAEVLESSVPVIVDFFAEWCMPCKMLAPVLDDVGTEKGGEVKIVKIDIDQDGALANQYNVRSVPTLIFFKNGQVEDQILGAVPKPVIMAKLSGL